MPGSDGPSPLLRAVIALAAGALVGLVVALVVPRDRPASAAGRE